MHNAHRYLLQKVPLFLGLVAKEEVRRGNSRCTMPRPSAKVGGFTLLT